MSTFLQDLSISKSGQLSPLPERHSNPLCIHQLAFSNDPEDYIVFLQARILIWDIAMRTSCTEELPATFNVYSKTPEEKSAGLSLPCPSLGLYLPESLGFYGDEAPQATKDRVIPTLDAMSFSTEVTGFFSSVFHSTAPYDESQQTYGLSEVRLLLPDAKDTCKAFPISIQASPPIPSFFDTPSLGSTYSILPDDPQEEESVELFSLEEINRKDFHRIPALVLRENEVIGDRILNPRQGGYFYYDSNVPQLHDLVEQRSMQEMPREEALAEGGYLQEHAVRLFLEVPACPSVTSTPMYKYIGDFYLQKADKWLTHEEWMACREETKTAVIERFVKHQIRSTHQSHGGLLNDTSEEVTKLFAQGKVLPRITLHPTYPDNALHTIDPLPSPLLDIKETMDAFAMLDTQLESDLPAFDSDSMYSHNSASPSLLEPPPRISLNDRSTPNISTTRVPVGKTGSHSDFWADKSENAHYPFNRSSTLVESIDGVTMREPEEFSFKVATGAFYRRPTPGVATLGNHCTSRKCADEILQNKPKRRNSRPVFANVLKMFRGATKQEVFPRSSLSPLRYATSLSRKFSWTTRPSKDTL